MTISPAHYFHKYAVGEINMNCFIWQDSVYEDQLIFKMKTKLQAGVPFVWEFHCSVGEKYMVRKEITQQEH